MCRKRKLHILLKREKQKGFLVPMAAIIVVGIAVLAITISRVAGQSGLTAIQEGLSVQAFYAADSGAQYAMNQVFFSGTTRASTDSNCTAVSGSTLNYSVTGLNSCSTLITCTISVDAGNTSSFYLINSAASCGSNSSLAQRTVAVSAFMQ